MTSVKDIKTAEQRIEGGSYLGTGTFVSGSDSVKTGYAGSAAQIAARNDEIADLRAYAEQLERDVNALREQVKTVQNDIEVAYSRGWLDRADAEEARRVSQPVGAVVTRLDVMSLIRQQMHRVYASAIDREEIDSKHMAEIESAVSALAAQTPAQQSGWKMPSIDEMLEILKSLYIENGECTDNGIVYEVTFDSLRSLYMKGLAAEPSPEAQGE